MKAYIQPILDLTGNPLFGTNAPCTWLFVGESQAELDDSDSKQFTALDKLT